MWASLTEPAFWTAVVIGQEQGPSPHRVGCEPEGRPDTPLQGTGGQEAYERAL